jgi:hypothetical protein
MSFFKKTKQDPDLRQKCLECLEAYKNFLLDLLGSQSHTRKLHGQYLGSVREFARCLQEFASQTSSAGPNGSTNIKGYAQLLINYCHNNERLFEEANSAQQITSQYCNFVNESIAQVIDTTLTITSGIGYAGVKHIARPLPLTPELALTGFIHKPSLDSMKEHVAHVEKDLDARLQQMRQEQRRLEDDRNVFSS